MAEVWNGVPQHPGGGGLTPAQLQKLNGIEAGAEVNPLNLVKFSGIDGNISNLVAYDIGFYNGASQVQSGSISQVDRIYLSEDMGTFGASNPTLSSIVKPTRFLGDRASNGGSTILAFQKQGQTGFEFVEAENIEAYADSDNRKGYLLTNLTWESDYVFSTGAGSNWDVIAGTHLKFTKDIVNLVSEYAQLSGGNITAAFRRIVQRYNEEIDFSGTYTRVDALSTPSFGEWTINAVPTETSAAQVQIKPKESDVLSSSLSIVAGTYIKLSSDYIVEVTNDAINVSTGLWTFRVTHVEGTLPAVQSSHAIILEGADIERTEVAREAFHIHSPNIAGKGGQKGQAFTINASGETGWEDVIPASLVFTQLFNRMSVGDGNYTDANGQLLFSDGNAAPSDAPDATTFILINHNSPDGTDQSAEIQSIPVGEWMYVRVGDTFVSARIQYIDKVVDQSGTRFWIIPSETSKHTHAYDSLASGSASVGFTELVPDLNDLVEGTPTDDQIIKWNATNNRAEWSDAS